MDNTRARNQKASNGEWFSLSVYYFNIGSYNVVLYDDANDDVIARAKYPWITICLSLKRNQLDENIINDCQTNVSADRSSVN